MPKKQKSKTRMAELREAGVILSQRQVGLLLGIDATTVTRHENGERGMTREQIIAYATLYKVPTHELFFTAEEPQPA